MANLTQEQREVARFRVHHPDFRETSANIKIINDYLRKHGLKTTLDTLQEAFASEFLKLDHSTATAPAPVALKVALAPAQRTPTPPQPKALAPWEKKYGRELDADMVRAISFEEMRSYLRDPAWGMRFKHQIDALELVRSDLGY
jgi:hypothetical protein